MAEDGGLKAHYERDGKVANATMIKADLPSLHQAGCRRYMDAWQLRIPANRSDRRRKPVCIEVLIFRPKGAGPFRLAVINHGSTGRGGNPRRFTETWFAPDLADFLNDRGWIVAFPQRRGRGKSDGLYDEGLDVNRTRYSGDIDISLRGADRALSDVDAAITALRRRQDVAPTPVLLGGNSRGGVLSIAYAGQHPQHVAGVINFVGGWLGEALRREAP